MEEGRGAMEETSGIVKGVEAGRRGDYKKGRDG